jgi:23S rRNA (adenine2503-C2)-methyltransferase
MAAPPNLYGMERPELARFLEGYGVPAFHAGQLFRWLYSRGELDPSMWTDLSKRLRARIAADAVADPGRIADRAKADDGTLKYVVELPGGGSVETVLMEQADRQTLCLSSQCGCPFDCDFCLTGKMGFVRQLTPGEIAGQAALVRGDGALSGGSCNIVFMGMGEPLHNYDAVLSAFRLLNDPEGFGLSRRRITVSTAGLAPAIERLAGEPLRPRLAVSLNATTDELRDRIMPINRKYPIGRLLEACSLFARTTGEEFTFEYVLLAGVNDSDEDIGRLERLVRSHRAKLNLIPFNAVPDKLQYRSPAKHRIIAIRDRLLRAGLAVSIRWSRGADSRAACGQLALPRAGPPKGEHQP